MKIYYIANARMPSEKAYGIQIAKMCEALIEEGTSLTLVVPTRGGGRASMKQFYGLRVDVPVVYLPAITFTRYERFGFFLMSLTFMISSCFFLLWRIMRGERFLLYSVDMDTFSFLSLLPLGALVMEIHSAKKNTFAHRTLFKRAQCIIATTKSTKHSLETMFSVPSKKLLVEPNGVDASQFSGLPSKEEARKKLGITGTLALYMGRFYRWKGLEVLSPAAQLLAQKNISVGLVGGSRADFERIMGNSAGLQFFGECPFEEMPLWLSAADVLLVIGTARNDDSFRYTSPMKLFEYAAVRRPIVASATEAITGVMSDAEAILCIPDDAASLAQGIEAALQDDSRVEAAYRMALSHTWQERAKRILAFCGALAHNTAHA